MLAVCSGGAKGWPDGVCARLLTLVPMAVLRQASRRHFILMQRQFVAFHCTIFHTSRGQLFGVHVTGRQDFERKFSKKISGDNPLRAVAGYPIPLSSTAFARKYPIAGTETTVSPQKLWCPTCAPTRTNSWRRHCLMLTDRKSFGESGADNDDGGQLKPKEQRTADAALRRG